MDRVIAPTQSLDGLGWRERNALKMRNRGGLGKFIPSTKNPLLAKILAMAGSASNSSSTSSSSKDKTSTKSHADEHRDAPVPAPSPSQHHVSAVPTKRKSTSNVKAKNAAARGPSPPPLVNLKALDSPVVTASAKPTTSRKRKGTLVDDSEDELALKTAPAKKRRTSSETAPPVEVTTSDKPSVKATRQPQKRSQPSDPIGNPNEVHSSSLSELKDKKSVTDTSLKGRPTNGSRQTRKPPVEISDTDDNIPIGELISRSKTTKGTRPQASSATEPPVKRKRKGQEEDLILDADANAAGNNPFKGETQPKEPTSSATLLPEELKKRPPKRKVPESDTDDPLAMPPIAKPSRKKSSTVSATRTTKAASKDDTGSSQTSKRRKPIMAASDSEADPLPIVAPSRTKKARGRPAARSQALQDASDAQITDEEPQPSRRRAKKVDPKLPIITESDHENRDASPPPKKVTKPKPAAHTAAKQKDDEPAKTSKAPQTLLKAKKPAPPRLDDSSDDEDAYIISKPKRLVSKSAPAPKTTDSEAKPAKPSKTAAGSGRATKSSYQVVLSEDEAPHKSSGKVVQPSSKPLPKGERAISITSSSTANGKPKRPSLSALASDSDVDDVAIEANKKADEVVQVVRRVPLPPPTSDVELDDDVDEISRPPLRKKAKSAPSVSKKATTSRLSAKASVGEAGPPSDGTQLLERPTLRRLDSSSTLIPSAASSMSSVTTKLSNSSTTSSGRSRSKNDPNTLASTSISNSKSTKSSKRPTAPSRTSSKSSRPTGKRKRYEPDDDSDPDPLDLFAVG